MTREARHHHQKRSGIQACGCAGGSLSSRMPSHVRKFVVSDHRMACRCKTSRKPSRLLTSSRNKGARKAGAIFREPMVENLGSSFMIGDGSSPTGEADIPFSIFNSGSSRLDSQATSRLYKMPQEP